MSLTLVLGGARSGKSAYAEDLAKNTAQTVVYVATAEVHDEAIEKRVALHKDSRPTHWRTVESPLQLANTLQEITDEKVTVLVDCLTMWVTNCLCAEDKDLLKQEIDDFLGVLAALKGEIILVSNEVGLGVIPMGELTRDYVDTAGKLHQTIAAQADNVVMVVAGLPMAFKGTS